MEEALGNGAEEMNIDETILKRLPLNDVEDM